MVELLPGLWIQSSQVALIEEPSNLPGKTVIVLAGGKQIVVGLPHDKVLRKLGLVTEWQHPPGQRPPE